MLRLVFLDFFVGLLPCCKWANAKYRVAAVRIVVAYPLFEDIAHPQWWSGPSKNTRKDAERDVDDGPPDVIPLRLRRYVYLLLRLCV